MIFRLMDDFQMHHKTNIEKNFKSKDGKVATNDMENAEILKAHFTSLFNSHTRVDFSVLDKISNHTFQHILGEAPSETEIKRKLYLRWLAIKLLANLASPWT